MGHLAWLWTAFGERGRWRRGCGSWAGGGVGLGGGRVSVQPLRWLTVCLGIGGLGPWCPGWRGLAGVGGWRGSGAVVTRLAGAQAWGRGPGMRGGARRPGRGGRLGIGHRMAGTVGLPGSDRGEAAAGDASDEHQGTMRHPTADLTDDAPPYGRPHGRCATLRPTSRTMRHPGGGPHGPMRHPPKLVEKTSHTDGFSTTPEVAPRTDAPPTQAGRENVAYGRFLDHPGGGPTNRCATHPSWSRKRRIRTVSRPGRVAGPTD